MTSRPEISIWDPTKDNFSVLGKVALPAVFTAPIRLDIVNFVHHCLNRNRRQAHGVDPRQGHKHSAESWGTGRAVARIPRVSGSGTNRSGQGAFGNQCRKGRMFAPLRTFRRWHRKVNINQKRNAVAAALAASALVPLVQARGHAINQIPELPLVFSDKIESYEKTKEAVNFFKRAAAYEDVKLVRQTQNNHSGKAKSRGKYTHTRRGPLIVYGNENVKLLQAVRNLPGVDVCNVNRLNLLQLAPGGQLGRFIIWTESAFKSLNKIFGTYRYSGIEKGDFQLNRPVLANADIARIINSNEIQSVLRPAKESDYLHTSQKKNPLINRKSQAWLNPNAPLVQAMARKQNEEGRKQREKLLAEKRGFSKSQTKEQKDAHKARRKASKKWIADFTSRMTEATNKDLKVEDGWRQEQLAILKLAREEDTGVKIKKVAAEKTEEKKDDKKDDKKAAKDDKKATKDDKKDAKKK